MASRPGSLAPSEVAALEQEGFAVGRKIGEGAHSTVLLAEYADKSGAKKKRLRLACKVVDKEKVSKNYLDKFFPRELEILAKIENPHIVQVHSIFQYGPRVFIFMQYAENGDLLEYITRTGSVAEHQAKFWFQQIASGVQYLHGKNIAHRDLKCENVLLTRRLNAKLTDFGFARFAVDARGRRVLSRTFCGSAAYAAPEVVSGTPYNAKQADVWSLGIVLYVMLNASFPFDDTNVRKLLRDQLARSWAFRSHVRERLSDAVKALVRLILEPDLALRVTLPQVLLHEWVAPRGTKECAKPPPPPPPPLPPPAP